MRNSILFIIFIAITTKTMAQTNDKDNVPATPEYISISGRVMDYNGSPIDSCSVSISNADFSTLYETYSDSNGYYRLDSIPKGRYAALCAMRPKEYPRMLMVPKEEMRLEFWAWNLIAENDIKLDIRYGKLELYGTTAFFEYGGRQELLIYTRPMSVTKSISYENFADKADAEINGGKVTVEPDYISFEVYADGTPLHIYSIQHLSLPHLNGSTQNSKGNDDCYLIQTSIPSDIYNHNNTPYEIRVVGHNSEFDEHGENVYYLEAPHYIYKPLPTTLD